MLKNLLIPVAAAAVEEASMAETAATYAGKFFLGGAIILAALIIAYIAKKSVQRSIKNRLQAESQQGMVILYGRLVFSAIFAIGGMIGLQIAGANLEWFAGAIGVAVGFGLKDAFGNFFAGIVLLTSDKFNIGDFVNVGEKSGTITDIQGRSTTLRGVDGAEITIPNSQMLNSQVECYTANPIRRINLSVGVGYDANIDEACRIVYETVKANPGVEPEPDVAVLVSEIADSAVTLEIRFWAESHSKWWETKSQITRDVFNALGRAGIDIPYPVKTLRVDSHSSYILAGQKNLLPKLEKIEQQKQVAKPVVTPQPVAAKPAPAQPAPVVAATPAPQPVAAAPVKMPQPEPAKMQAFTPTPVETK